MCVGVGTADFVGVGFGVVVGVAVGVGVGVGVGGGVGVGVTVAVSGDGPAGELLASALADVPTELRLAGLPLVALVVAVLGEPAADDDPADDE